jgi:glycosyltransferase involved in cell wall biosynthesis
MDYSYLPEIVITRSNFASYDSRLRKYVRSLSKKYSVTILGWNRGDSSKNNKNNDSMNVDFFNLKAPYGKQKRISYVYMMTYFSLFWTWIFIKLIIYRPKVVHAFDLDTVIPCYIYKKLFRRRLVFEIVDRYAMNAIPKKFRLIYSFVHRLENSFAQKADLLITVGDKMLDTIKCKPKKSVVILNCPEDYDIDKKKIKTEEDAIFKVVYAERVITRIRGVSDMAAAIRDLNNVRLVIAGTFIDQKLYAEIAESPNVKYVGILQPADALDLEVTCDAMIALYDPENPQTDIVNPTKFFESMMSKVPIITNIRSDFINEIGFGIIVEYGNIDQITSAIITLRDNPELRKRLGENGRRAFVKKYNWGIMEQKLFDAYDGII